MVTDEPQLRGFTLLEVLLALVILATALTILTGMMANSNLQSAYANRVTRVSEQGFSEVTWKAEIQPIEIPDKVKEQLLGKVNAQLFGGAQSKGALKGNAAFSSKLPKLIGCVPQMINRIGKKVRRIILIV
ncbi:MAG: prepilin-type N-terminal cleavage/methylation domain-containing protein, partial [Bradymonadaceae bacterium]